MSKSFAGVTIFEKGGSKTYFEFSSSFLGILGMVGSEQEDGTNLKSMFINHWILTYLHTYLYLDQYNRMPIN